jgi:hypothetical protein
MNAHGWLALALGFLLPTCGGASSDATGSCLPDTAGCDTADSPGNGAAVQMNDVTIVMPLAKTQTELDAYLPATGAGAKGVLLPQAIYTAKFPDPGHGGVGGDVQMQYAKLRVVAVRFDPCFAQIGPITDPSSCQNQIRLVFQDLTLSGGSTSAIDGAVHAFYSLDRAELTQAMREVIDLRRASGQTRNMGPLAPHPLVVKQGIDGAFSQGLSKIILEHAGASNLVRFTHFQSSNLQTVWTFNGFDLSADGTATAMVIPTLPASATVGKFFAGFGASLAGGFTPETTSSDDVALLVNVTNAKAATHAAVQAAYDASLRIENPSLHSPNTIDCASCHIAETARLLTGEDVLHLASDDVSNVFHPDPKFVSDANAAAKTTPRGQTVNLHMISYRNSSLLIGQRVINETANVVAYANGTIRP